MKTVPIKYIRKCFLWMLLLLASTGMAQSNTVEFSVNGLKVILRQTQKETLVISMYFRGGSANYTAANAGIESLAMAGLIECGNSTYSANDFNDQADEYGLHFLGDANNDYSRIKMGCISRYMDEAWKLFSTAIAAPVFDAQKFALLKQQKTDQLKAQLSDPDERLKQLAQEFAFARTSYAVNPDGSVTSLQSLTREAVKDYYYNTLLNKNRMFLVVAGNITKENLEKKILASFSSIPAKEYKAAALENITFNKETYKIEDRPIATNYVSGILNAPSLNSADYPAYRLAITILNSGLFEVIRLQKRLSYAPYAAITEGKISYATMYASTTDPFETVKAMRMILGFMKNKTYSQKLIEDIRKGQLLTYTKGQEVMSDIVDQLGKAEIAGTWKLAENLAERMGSVTPEALRDALNSYARNITWVYIGDKTAGEQSFNQ